MNGLTAENRTKDLLKQLNALFNLILSNNKNYNSCEWINSNKKKKKKKKKYWSWVIIMVKSESYFQESLFLLTKSQ